MRVAWTNAGVRQFMVDINQMCSNGWRVRAITVVPTFLGLRFLMSCLLWPEDQMCGCEQEEEEE